MNDRTFVYIIVAIVVAHFLFAMGFLIWKITKASRSSDQEVEIDEVEKKDQL